MCNRPCIVAIGAHAADMEFSAGATLLKHAHNGWDVHIIHLTLGEKGNLQLSPEEYGEQKKREAQAAAKILRATPHFLPYSDGELSVNDDIIHQVAKLLRQLQPQVIITHWRNSIHSDHVATHHVTHRAVFIAANPHFNLGGLPRLRGARLYYAENWEDAEGFRPFVYVDISNVFSEWERAFKSFAIGRSEGDFPYWDWYCSRTRIRGIDIGVMYAQAFAVDEHRMRQHRELL